MLYCCKPKWCCLFYAWFISRQPKWCTYIWSMWNITINKSWWWLTFVDKGLTIQHLLLTKEATIFIPPFLGKKDAFTKEEVMLFKQTAKVRIHMKRFNNFFKRNWILDHSIPLNLHLIASQMIYVASCLVKFQECLCVWYWTSKKLHWKHWKVNG